MEQGSPRLLIAGTGSGSGKTTVTAGLLQCLKQRGLRVASFKCGPDYIDPMFHRRITGVPAGTLDPYFCDGKTLRYLMQSESEGCDAAVAEGVMGYYDGIGFSSRASTMTVAQETDTPVVLVLGCRGTGASIMAVLRGFLTHSEGGEGIRAVIFNQLPERFADEAARAAEAMGVLPLGYLPADRRFSLESRHLGLMAPEELANIDETLQLVSEQMEKTVDIQGLLDLAATAPPLDAGLPVPLEGSPMAGGARVGVARDQAFSFLYRENIRFLQEEGCRIEYFSPLTDPKLPDGVQGLILPGGYPELHTEGLALNESMRQSIREAVQSGMPVIAECGGFLYLHDVLEGTDGVPGEMTGLIPGRAYGAGRLGPFGYVTMRSRENGLLCDAGEELKAHEFHYWRSSAPGEAFQIEKADGSREWSGGYHTETMYAGFPHLHFYACPEAARRFIRRCMKQS